MTRGCKGSTIAGTNAAGTDLKQALHEGDAVGQAGLLGTQAVNLVAALLQLHGGCLSRQQLRMVLLVLCLQAGHCAAQLPELQPAPQIDIPDAPSSLSDLHVSAEPRWAVMYACVM